MMDTENSTTGDALLGRSAKWSNYQKYVIFLLLLVHMFNLMDRQVINVLSPAIQQEFDLNDSQIGILTGLSFCLLYTSPSPRDGLLSRMPSSA